MGFLVGMVTGGAFVALAWFANEVRWHWKITQDVHDHDDPDDRIFARYRSIRKH